MNSDNSAIPEGKNIVHHFGNLTVGYSTITIFFKLKKLLFNSLLKIKKNIHIEQHRESVNIKTFDQSEHDTRNRYYGRAASKACLQALPPFPPPQSTAFPCFAPFFFFFTFFPAYCGAQAPGYRRRPGVRIKRVPVRGAGLHYIYFFKKRKCYY